MKGKLRSLFTKRAETADKEAMDAEQNMKNDADMDDASMMDGESLESATEGQEQKDERTIAIERANQDLKDQLLRRTAEIDNMRRRHLQEREQLTFEGNRRLLNDILPTIDDLERTLEHAADQKDAVSQGVDLVYKNLLKTLERYGVKAMATAGEMFDPHKHDALMEEPRTDVPAGTITREIQRGYMLNDSVLRHAKVFVAKDAE